MPESERQRQYRDDAHVLGEIGALLARTDLPKVTVRLSLTLAHAAVKAWSRDDEGEPDPECYEQRVMRHRAGTLALIGLSVEQGGHIDGDDMVVDLTPDLIGVAVDAVDDLPR
jgi:hypothetical protein